MAGEGVALLFKLLFQLVLFVLWMWVCYWVSQDAKRRGSSHHVAWGLGVFFTGFIVLIPYLIVRGNPD